MNRKNTTEKGSEGLLKPGPKINYCDDQSNQETRGIVPFKRHKTRELACRNNDYLSDECE